VGGPPTNGSAFIGSLLSSNQGAQLGLPAFFSMFEGIGVGEFIRPEILQTMALGPSTGLNIQGGAVNQTIVVCVVWKIEPINRTRTGGL
jgi:hypothetical protein